MSDTPRTDAQWAYFVRENMHDAGEHFARQLERELAAALKAEANWEAVAAERDQENKEMARELAGANDWLASWKSSHGLAQVEINTLQRRVQELEARVGTWHDCYAQAKAVDRANAELAAARADTVRLRATLDIIANTCPCDNDGQGCPCEDVAREAIDAIDKARTTQ
jgi:predicted metal-dependent peptidase